MRSTFVRCGTLAALFLVGNVGGADAQGLRRPAPSPLGDRPEPPADSLQESFPLRARLLTGTGAAVLGAGLGFFASQVARGDWEDGPGGHPIDRPLWAAIGGGVGFAVGFRFPLARMGVGAERRDALPTGRSRLGAKEILDAKVVNAYEAVRLLRPEWFVLRGHQTLLPPGQW